MVNQVVVVTDSTASLPAHLIKQWGIKVIQLQLIVGDEMNEEHRFDRRYVAESLRGGKRVATTPPDPAAFFWTYQEAAAKGASAVVSLHLSENLSETVNVARQAAQSANIPVYALDTRTTGMSLGFAVLSAARAAGAGAGVDRVIDAAQRRYARSSELLYVDTLEYLRRGGRIGAAAALIGTALSLKPLLTVKKGEVSPLARVPGTRRAMSRLVSLAVERAGSDPVDLAISTWEEGERERALAQELRTQIPQCRDVLIAEASTVIGAHVGPGALSVTVSPA